VTAFAWGSVAGPASGLNREGSIAAYNSNTAATKKCWLSLFIGAIDDMPVKDVHLMPNIWMQS